MLNCTSFTFSSLTVYKQQTKYKEVTGKDFGPPPKEKKEKKQPQEQQAPSAKNAEKKAAKVHTLYIMTYCLFACAAQYQYVICI